MESLQRILLEDGTKHGMCEKYQRILANEQLTIDQLLRLFHSGQDFCIKEDWPSLDMARSIFDKEDLERNFIFVDGTGEHTVSRNVVVMGDSDITIVVPEWTVASIEVRHNSKVRLKLGHHSNCYVSTHDNCEVIVSCKEVGSRLCASHFSGVIADKDMFNKINYKN